MSDNGEEENMMLEDKVAVVTGSGQGKGFCRDKVRQRSLGRPYSLGYIQEAPQSSASERSALCHFVHSDSVLEPAATFGISLLGIFLNT